jgi:hypothetical protein
MQKKKFKLMDTHFMKTKNLKKSLESFILSEKLSMIVDAGLIISIALLAFQLFIKLLTNQ